MSKDDFSRQSNDNSADALVGRRLREMRNRQGLSLRVLAERSGLNVNTLSLVENQRCSPSVSTLQQLAAALEVPIARFFETETPSKQVVYTPVDRRPQDHIGSTGMQNLGKDLEGNAVQPFIVTLEPGAGSGDRMIVHTGYELVYCLSGVVRYTITSQDYDLKPGDSLVFQAHLPHYWENFSEQPAQIMLVFFPADEHEKPGSRHFALENQKKEFCMKIAVITDDGNSISRHFGRAPYYLVLTIEDGKISGREMRDKMGHTHFTHQAHGEESHAAGRGHGMDAASHNKHISMAEAISDCEALICGGMGMGAYESMRRLNIKPVVTELSDIETAVQAYIDGKLVDRTEMLH